MENQARPQNEYYPFEQFAVDVEKIAKTVEASGRKFTKIWGPARGGLPLAVCLSHRLNLQLELTPPINILAGISARLDSDKVGAFIQQVTKDMLVVDDIADTGKVLGKYKAAGFFIATLYYKRCCSFVPDIWLHEKKEAYIDFWWETMGKKIQCEQPLV